MTTNPASMDFIAGLRSDAVKNATGRDWRAWFSLLDQAGAGRLPRRELASFLQETQGLSGWWSKTVAAGYEQSRGRYPVPARMERLVMSRSFDAPVAVLFKAWTNDARRIRWLPEGPLLIRKAVPDRLMRITWADGSSTVNVIFQEGGPMAGTIRIEHAGLAGRGQVAAQQAYWTEALNSLQRFLETHIGEL